MTNKFYNEKANLSVYIANLGEYVKGNLVGDWISLPIEESDFEDFLKTIGNPEDLKSFKGTVPEELVECHSRIESTIDELAQKLEEQVDHTKKSLQEKESTPCIVTGKQIGRAHV